MQDTSRDSDPLPRAFTDRARTIGPYGCYLYLILYKRSGGTTDWFDAPLRMLAEFCGVSVPKIRASMIPLIDLGLIERDKGMGATEATRYRMVLPDEPEAQPEPEVVQPIPLFSMPRTDFVAEEPEPVKEPFEVWWATMPKKASKGQARTTWEKLANAGKLPTLEVLIAGGVRYSNYVAAYKVPPDKVQHPSTWLNAEGWDNDFAVSHRSTARVGHYEEL